MYALQIDRTHYGLDREQLMSKMSSHKIQTRPLWQLNHLQRPYTQYQHYRIERALHLFDVTLNLPCSVDLTPAADSARHRSLATNTMKDIVIVGHGGLAREVAFLIGEINRKTPTWNLLGYITSDKRSVSLSIGRHAVRATDEWLSKSTEGMAVAIAIGQPARLRALHERFRQNPRLSFPNLIHPSVTGDWERISMDSGNIVLNNASFTTDIKLDSLNVINPGATIAHDCVLGSYNLINPGARLSGEVVLGDEIVIGTGACILQQLRLCSGSVVGAGAVVTRSIEKPGVYIGIPRGK